MCLYLPKEMFNEPRTASKPIKVYKIVYQYHDGSLTGPYYHYPWTVRRVHTVNPSKWQISLDAAYWGRGVNYGFHSIRSLREAKREFREFDNVAKYRIYEAEIPKGAQYFVGQNSEVASNKLKLVRLVKL